MRPSDETLWTRTSELPRRPPLARSERCDVCVVGAGIAGVSTAWRLASEGRDVVLVDRAGVAAGETRRTSAHLASAQDDGMHRIAARHGEEAARHVAASHAAAIDWIEAQTRQLAIDCGFERVTGYLFAAPGEDSSSLDEEAEASRLAGLVVERLERAPLPSFDTGPCLAFADQGLFHPLRFVAGLVPRIEAAGGRVYCDTRVVDVEDGEPCRVETEGGHVVITDDVVLATNSPSSTYLTPMKMVPNRTYLATLRVAGEISPGLYWDTAAPYHYVRVANDGGGELLLIGGEDHPTGSEEGAGARYDRLAAWARERFPVGEVISTWSGQVLEPADALAFIGRARSGGRVHLCTGDSGQGLTHGVVCALLVGDLVLGRPNDWEETYAPTRLTPGALPDYLADAARIGRGYLDWLLPGDRRAPGDLRSGEGAVLWEEGRPVAVWRDRHGALHRHSAVCPHAGCIVRWNAEAGEWNCPCHGSRFEGDGTLAGGPASEDLRA